MPGDRQQLRRDLMRLVGAQDGYFTAAQAVQIGYSHQAQKFHVDHSNWARVDRALFRIPEWPTGDDDGLARWTVWSGGIAVVSHLSALAWHDLGDANPAHLHLSVPVGFRRSDPALVLHRAVPTPDELLDRGSFRVTRPVRAVAESATAGVDQSILDSAISDLLERGTSERELRDAAAPLGPRAELGVERALSGRHEK